MHVHKMKTKKNSISGKVNKKNAIAGSGLRNDNNDGLGISDNRLAAARQLKLQKMATHSNQINQKILNNRQINKESVVMRKTDDLLEHRENIKTYSKTFGRNCWDDLKDALDTYIALDNGDYVGRRAQIAVIINLIDPCKQDALTFNEGKKIIAIQQIMAIKPQLDMEKDELHETGTLNPGGVIPQTQEPDNTVSADPGTVDSGTNIYTTEDCNTVARQAVLNTDKTALGGVIAPFPVIDCFIVEETMTASKIVYWELKVYDMALGQLTETKQTRREGWVKNADLSKNAVGGKTVLPIVGAANSDKTAQPLFPKKPTIEDIKQVGLADCYLLAALTGVVNKSPAFIEGMMKDNGDGTVTVRLYDVVMNLMARNYNVRYIRINKSIVQVGGHDAYAHGALWVQLLEKAFAAAGYTGKSGGPQNPPQTAVNPSYGEIEFGKGEIAMEHLLGHGSRVNDLETRGGDIPAALGPAVTRLPWDNQEIIDHQTHAASQNKVQDYQVLASYHILGGNIGNIDTWFNYLNTLPSSLPDTVKARAQKGAIPDAYQAEIRLEDFEAVFKTGGLSSGVRTTILNWLKTNHIYPGKRGTGNYTNRQIEIFNSIVTELTTNNATVTLASRKEVARVSTGIGRTGGEAMGKGLAGRHEYAVLDYGYGGGKTHNQANGPKRWLKLRNPWGQYGRGYTSSFMSSLLKSVAIDVGNGQFWLELSDVTKRFKATSASNV